MDGERQDGFNLRRLGWLLAGAIVAALVLGLLLWSQRQPVERRAAIEAGAADVADAADAAPGADGDGVRTTFGFCHGGGGDNCVVDGDTFQLNGQRIGIAGIDAPEIYQFDCPAEKRLGNQARRRLQELLNRGTVTVTPTDRDRDTYGRHLRYVQVNGADVGAAMIASGLAQEGDNGQGSWCG